MKKILGCLLILWLLTACRAFNQNESLEATRSKTAAPTATARQTILPAYLPPPGTPGEFQPAACRFALPDEIVEGQVVECGFLTVIEQRDGQTSQPARLIRIAVAVFHPPGGATQLDPVIYLAGGPGASALELIHYQYDDLSAPVFASGRDLVLFDQRGVGLSLPALDCPGYDEAILELLDLELEGRPLSEEALHQLLLDRLRDCRKILAQSADLSAYNSAASADDLQDLIQAFGWQEVNLWGGSYGTRLALEVMRRHPQQLRSVVLDAVYPPDVDLYRTAPANFQRALARLFTACQENPVCQADYPNLRQVFFDTVQNLNEQPVMDEIRDPFSGETFSARMDGNTLLALTFQLLYDSRLRYLLPQQIYAASQGDYTAFEQVRGSLIGIQSLASRGMMFSVQCHEEIPFSNLADFQAELTHYPELGGMYENGLLGGLSYRICAEWGAGQADASANQPVTSDIPTLLMSGEFDPITPPEWGLQAAQTLSRGYFFEYPGLGHGASALPGCPSQMFTDFLVNPEIAPNGSCIEEMFH